MIATISAYLLFIFVIAKSNFFIKNSIHDYAMPFFFSLKIAAGFVLYYIYNHFYDNRATGDVNKYFDDAIEIYKALNGNVIDYFKILLNIDCERPEIIRYFSMIDHWDLNERGNFFVNDARTVIRFNLLLLPISKGYYHFHSVIINFISFTGAVFIYNVFCNENKNNKLLYSLICFLIPSVVFWCSGVLKEGLLLFFLGLAIHSTYSFFFNKKKYKTSSTLFAIAFFGILHTKFYVAFALIPAVFFLALQQVTNLKYWQCTLVVFLFGVAFLCSNNGITNSFKDKLTRKQKEFVNVARGGYYFEMKRNNATDTLFIDEIETENLLQIADSNYTTKAVCKAVYYKNLEIGENIILKPNQAQLNLLEHIEPVNSNIYLPPLNASFKSILKATPVAIFNALFLPTLLGIKNVMYIMPAIENLLFILIIASAITKRKKINIQHQKFIWFCVIYSICLLIIIGITTPVLGALVRYKVPTLPFIFFIVISFTDFKIINKISRKLGI